MTSAGCGDGEQQASPRTPLSNGTRDDGSAEFAQGSGDELDYLEELADLGYVDFGASSEEDESLGEGEREGPLKIYDAEAAWDGINLYLSLPDAAGYLMDMDGSILHEWRDPGERDTRWSRIELLPNGDALCVSPKENRLMCLAWDGSERWRIPIDTHHDVRCMPDGRIVTLTRSLRQLPEIHPTRRSVDNGLAWLDSDGRLLSEHSLYDILSTVPELPLAAPKQIDKAPAGANVDPIHANTVEPMRFASLAAADGMFAQDNLLLTLRVPCAIVMLTPDAGHAGGYRTVWCWGMGELEGPHDATVMESGNILVLDNGWVERGYSRVLEIDPIAREIVWEYKAPVPEDFFTSGRGTAQPLPNGNVLVGNSNSGEAFEVTRAGRIVWRYLNPSVNEQGKRGVLRIRRFDRVAIESILDRFDAGG